MWRSVVLWVVAVLVTLTSAVWQRTSGPTYPVRGEVTLGGETVALELTRTHGGDGDQPVRVRVASPQISGEVAWRHFPTGEPWQILPMQRAGEWLEAALPHQPPAGKLEYQVHLVGAGEAAVFPPLPAVTRFKGDVPAAILAPHILLMFTAMLCSTAAGLRALVAVGDPRRLAYVTLAVIAVGGFVLGPAVQKYAFDAWWTGIPFGWDLTDNKTLAAGAAWAWAAWRLRGGRRARWDVVGAALVTLVVFAIPHSVWGSQIDWSSLPPAGTATGKAP